MRYESAMDAQRYNQQQRVIVAKNSQRQVKTPLKLERHAMQEYTPEVFNDLLEELITTCFRCRMASFGVARDIKIFSVLDTEFYG